MGEPQYTPVDLTELGLDQILSDKFLICDGGIHRKHPKAPVTGGYMSFHFQYNGAVFRLIKHENGAKSSNDSEYLSLIYSIQGMVFNARYQSVFPGTIIFMDSKLVVNQVNGIWRVNAQHLIPHVLVCKRLIKDYQLELKWIPRKVVFEVLGH